MTVETLKSVTLTNLDAQPILVATSGEGSAGGMDAQQDNVALTAAYGSAAKNTARLARFPVTAKVKHVYIYGKGLDSNATAALTVDINVAFSDATNDGTPAAGQGLIPGSALTGAVTTLASYSSPNKMFGDAYLVVANNGAYKYSEVTYLNTYTPALALTPMWAVMGGSGVFSAAPFTAGGGFAQNAGTGNKASPGGFFDIYVVTTATTASTAASGNIGIEVDYVV